MAARLQVGDVDAVVPVVPVRDTIKRLSGGMVAETVDRSSLAAAQTPQGFRVASLVAAQAGSDEDASDEAALIERAGGVVATVPGDAANLKVTFPEDLAIVEAAPMRVGWGFDAHRFRGSGVVVMAGVVVDDARGVAATSDGDVPAHAVADALLGAAALGDLGALFPSDDPAWADADSMEMLDDVVLRVMAAGYRVASHRPDHHCRRRCGSPRTVKRSASTGLSLRLGIDRRRCPSRRPRPTGWVSWAPTRD